MSDETCRHCREPIRAINYALGPGWEHSKTRSSRCEHLIAGPVGSADYPEDCERAARQLGIKPRVRP